MTKIHHFSQDGMLLLILFHLCLFLFGWCISRAVQRSLAIIRQARQKKQKAKQYCMYYNRFGKCNHGDACPYIHDPDKVAVCTRYCIFALS